MDRKLNNALLAFFAIADLASFVGIIYAHAIDKTASGKFINDTFIENMRLSALSERLVSVCGLAFIIFAAVTAVLVFLRTYELNFSRLVVLIMIAALGFTFIKASIPPIYTLMTEKPYVVSSRISEKLYRPTRYGKNYYFRFEDGGQKKVGDTEYFVAAKGDKYYVIYCGNIVVAALSTNSYTLDSKYEKDKAE